MTNNNFQISVFKLRGREVLDSRARPTVGAELETDKGVFFASVPSGISTGKYEAVELRDEDGGVKSAIKNIEEIIAPVIIKQGLSGQKRRRIDEILIQLDGAKNKARLGANAILAVSMAACRAIAAAKNLSLWQYIHQLAENCSQPFLPKPSFNMIEGGKHAKNKLALQEFMVVPQRDVFKDNLLIGQEIYNSLKKVLEEKFGRENVGLSREGAFTAAIEKITDAFDLILEAAERAGHRKEIGFAIDAAASSFFSNGNYIIDNKILSKEKLIDFYKDIVENDKYAIVSIEDPFEEQDFIGFSDIMKKMGERLIVFGDDLLASNVERMKIAKEQGACNGLILKPNQIGTITETIEAARLAKSFGWKIMVANRAGETNDDFIADLAAGIAADFIKSGAPFPKERMAKYDRLSEIEKEMNLKKF